MKMMLVNMDMKKFLLGRKLYGDDFSLEQINK